MVSLPPGPFCDAVASGQAESHLEEDEVLQALQDLRLTGGISCGGGQPSTAGAALRLDPRLVCAARVLAADMNVTRVQSLTDSEGRDTRARLAAAGYVQSVWAESFALSPNSASDALRLMLEDTSSCEGLSGIGVRDVGVGSVGTVRVITLAAE